MNIIKSLLFLRKHLGEKGRFSYDFCFKSKFVLQKKFVIVLNILELLKMNERKSNLDLIKKA